MGILMKVPIALSLRNKSLDTKTGIKGKRLKIMMRLRNWKNKAP